MSALYARIWITVPAAASQHPQVAKIFSDHEDLEPICDFKPGGLSLCLDDTSDDQRHILRDLEAAGIPYDADYYSNETELDTCSWYRPHETPSRGTYLMADAPLVPWDLLVQLAHDSVGLTLNRIRVAAEIPATRLSESPVPSPLPPT
jgi:hypothetical protein